MNPRIAMPLYSVIGFSLLMALTGVLVAPSDAWPNVLLSGVFLSGLGLSGAFLVAVHDASNARWLGSVRGIALSFTRLVLPGSMLVLVAVLFGGTTLYPAFHEHFTGFKGLWLGRAFFTGRTIGYAVVWLASIAMLRRRRGSAAFLVIFGVTVWLSSVDWVMSLEPEWGSTMFGVYRFAGLVAGGLAAIVLVALHRSKSDSSVTGDRIHDLAKLLFAFSTFWMYIWFSQAMLIWYANLRDETGYYLRRAYGNWGLLFWGTVLLMWVLPFLALLSEKSKRNRTILSRIALVVLLGHWLDLYVSIVAATTPEPSLTGWDLAVAIGAFAAVGWAATRKETIVPKPAPVVSLPPREFVPETATAPRY